MGYVAGLAFFIPNLLWLRHSSRVIHGAMDNTWMGWGPESMGAAAVFFLSAYLSLYWGLWGAFASAIAKPRISLAEVGNTTGIASLSLESLRSAALCGAAWVAAEWLRGIIFTGFGWNGLGVGMRGNLAMIQSADMIGVTGLSFLPVFIACVAYNTVLRFQLEVKLSRVRPHLDFFAAAVLCVLNFFYGVNALSRKPTETVDVKTLLVQQNVPQVVRWSGDYTREIYEEIGDLTRLGVTSTKPDLVVWPESSLPLDFHDPNHIPFLNDVLALGDFSLLTGTDIYLPNEPGYTGAALMKGNYDNHQLHRKVHLVPFGEYLPLRSVPGVEALLGGILPGDFASGRSLEPLTLEKPSGVQIIPLICFEDTVGRLARKFIRDAPQLIVNMTNDGWFLQSNQNEVHVANALFRCIELRRPMARACNTGVTCFIDSRGVVLKSDKLEDRGTGSVFIKGFIPKNISVEKQPPMTFYAKHGDLFSIVMLGLSLLTTGTYWAGRKRRRSSESVS